MTLRAIAGLVVYNAFILAVGTGVLWGVRGWRSWTELVRLAGVAYLLGVSSLMVLLTLELVLGVPVGAAVIALSGVALAGAGVLVGRVRGHVRPGLSPPGWRIPGISVFAAMFAAGIVVWFESLFRADRLAGVVREWDSWAIWMPRAKSVYFFERLEPEFLLLIPQKPSYPPGLATIQAGAFHAMGSADTVSLHVQYWFFALGFVAAVIGLLGRRVHHAILFPLLLLVLVAPSLVERLAVLYSDIPLGYLVAVAAVLVILWIEERKAWHLYAATILLAGAMLTKREGFMFAACVLLAGLVASSNEWRRLWKPLAVAGVVALALTLPWRIWFTAHGLEGDGPDAGYLGAFGYLERVWPSLELAVTTFFHPGSWRDTPTILVAVIAIALVAGAWRAFAYTGTFLAAAIAGGTWVTWAYTDLPITRDDAQNPIVRITGTTILTLAVLAPLVLQRAWWGGAAGPAGAKPSQTVLPGPDALVSRSRWAWTIVLVGLFSHPGSMLLGYSGSGLPGGAPRWPEPADCVSAPVPGEAVRIVAGYAASYPEALDVRRRSEGAGLHGTEIARDGCGRLRVSIDGLSSLEAAQRMLASARQAGLEATLERDSGG